MESTKKQTTKRINTIVESYLSGCIDRANELRVTSEEFMGIYQLNGSFVLAYYR